MTIKLKEFPPSPELNSGKYYYCGVDVCEEGIQFCNRDDRRCEYCADHHQDCFTYAQQQNCTLYCQDQWRKTLFNNCTVCGPTECEDVLVYKILSFVFFFLWMIALLVLIIQRKRIRRVIQRVILVFIPDQIISAFEHLFTKNTTAGQNTQEKNSRDLEGTPTGDIENVRENNDNRRDITEESEIQKLTKRKPSVNQDSSQNKCNETNATNEVLKRNENMENKESVTSQKQPGMSCIVPSRRTVEKDNVRVKSLNEVGNGAQTAVNATIILGTNLDETHLPTDCLNGNEETLHINEETELLKQYNKTPEDLSEESQSDQHLYVTPHGELSTTSSRGGYQAMLQNSSQATDNGYVTTIDK